MNEQMSLRAERTEPPSTYLPTQLPNPKFNPKTKPNTNPIAADATYTRAVTVLWFHFWFGFGSVLHRKPRFRFFRVSVLREIWAKQTINCKRNNVIREPRQRFGLKTVTALRYTELQASSASPKLSALAILYKN